MTLPYVTKHDSANYYPYSHWTVQSGTRPDRNYDAVPGQTVSSGVLPDASYLQSLGYKTDDYFYRAPTKS